MSQTHLAFQFCPSLEFKQIPVVRASCGTPAYSSSQPVGILMHSEVLILLI